MRGRAVLASCSAAAILAAPAAAAAAGLSLRAEPDRLMLGRDARATIELEGFPGAPPSVTANVGRIEGLRSAGGGRFVAEYAPPAERHPQVAIVAASAGDAWAWTAIPLVGRGLAIARSAPHARIRVTIGGASFGPVTADASGAARVPVVVPPGARFAYHREKPLELNVPPVLHVHVALGRPEAPADAAHDLPLRAFVVAPSGAARAGAPLRVEVSEGRVEGLAEIAPGSWAGTWRLAPGRAGVARASAALADEPELAASVQLPRPAGPLARLAVQTAGGRVAADGTVPLRVVATDAAGNAVETAPKLHATLGELSELAPVAPGTWEARLAVPPRIGAIRRLELVARAGAIEGRTELEVAAGPPVELEVSTESASLVADGGAVARVHVLLRDRFGNPADAPVPDVVATRRARIAAEPGGPGVWVVRYRPARAREDAADVLTIRAAGLEGAARLEIVAPERRLGLAPKLGFAASSGGLRAPYAALEAAYRPDVLHDRLSVAIELGRFVHERTDTAPVGEPALAIRGRAQYVPLLGTARWRAPLGERHALWAGAGGGLAHVSSEVAPEGGPTAVEAGVVPVIHAGAGWGRRHRHGEPFLEARLAWHGDPRLEAFRGSLTVFLVAIGFRYDAY